MDPHPSRLRIATYNIHGCYGMDGRRSPARIAAVIRELDADVVALQEVAYPGEDDHELRTPIVLAELGHYAFIRGPTFACDGRQWANVLLVRHPIRGVERLDLSSDGCEPRGALDVTLDVDGIDVRVVATHLGLRLGERRTQVDRLIEHLDRNPAPFEVVLGDFNDWMPGISTAHLLAARLGHTPRRRTYPAPFPLLCLDRIWVHPGSALVDVRAHGSFRARHASDHLPLVATLELPRRDHAAEDHPRVSADGDAR